MWKRAPGVEFKYKGKRYFFNFIWKGSKGPSKVRPIDEPKNEADEVTVKDYEVGKWNVTVNVNGETIIVGWGPLKHLTFWGSILFLLVIIIYFIRRRLIKIDKERWQRIGKEAKKT